MKKLLTVFLCLSLFAVSASVSFASDGTKTTKDCVIDNLGVMEASIVADEVVTFSAQAEFVRSYCVSGTNEGEVSADNIGERYFAENHRTSDRLMHIDPGVSVSNFLNTTKTKVTNSTGYSYTCNDNRVRMLIKS